MFRVSVALRDPVSGLVLDAQEARLRFCPMRLDLNHLFVDLMPVADGPAIEVRSEPSITRPDHSVRLGLTMSFNCAALERGEPGPGPDGAWQVDHPIGPGLRAHITFTRQNPDAPDEPVDQNAVEIDHLLGLVQRRPAAAVAAAPAAQVARELQPTSVEHRVNLISWLLSFLVCPFWLHLLIEGPTSLVMLVRPQWIPLPQTTAEASFYVSGIGNLLLCLNLLVWRVARDDHTSESKKLVSSALRLYHVLSLVLVCWQITSTTESISATTITSLFVHGVIAALLLRATPETIRSAEFQCTMADQHQAGMEEDDDFGDFTSTTPAVTAVPTATTVPPTIPIATPTPSAGCSGGARRKR